MKWNNWHKWTDTNRILGICIFHTYIKATTLQGNYIITLTIKLMWIDNRYHVQAYQRLSVRLYYHNVCYMCVTVEIIDGINTLRPWQNGCDFADDTFKCIFLNENVRISIKISLKFVPKGPINNNPALVQIMAWCQSGNKPLSEPMMVSLLMHTCVTPSHWVKYISDKLLHLVFYLTRGPCLFFSRSLDGGDLYGHNSHLCLPLRSYNMGMCYLSMHTTRWGDKVNQLTWLLELQYRQVSNIRRTLKGN